MKFYLPDIGFPKGYLIYAISSESLLFEKYSFAHFYFKFCLKNTENGTHFLLGNPVRKKVTVVVSAGPQEILETKPNRTKFF